MIMRRRPCSGMVSLTSYSSVKCVWVREDYIKCCKRNDSRGVAWWKLCVRKLKGYRGKAVKGLCPMCSELECAKHVILGCGETAGWRIS